ncbi:hypothetical protein SAMN02745126_02655 [Enhydrobacter aerosaccus]|uniref:Uncharacterized protein n=1 Tax=Enhydrobacter aerosaccus TaxID=225324 RepID=A0A1T4P7J7_9HYPH|nr:hypothetical protein [Enhydrobacter aerosaccus]SJZ87381.1 hypothetical protein SAMN02745126_02655 [Enhydrobacter aerosaccus]
MGQGAVRGVAVMVTMLALWDRGASLAQGVGFLTEQQRLASYCTGVSEARLRDLNDFLKIDCAGSKRKECVTAADELGRAQIMDRRLWAYLTKEIFTSKDQGPRERALAYSQMTRGSDNWLACKRRPPRTDPDNLPACRESRGCLIEERFSFLPP